VYESKKDYARAIADFSQAIALDPKLAPPLNNRCYDNAIVGQLQAAAADCNQALALRPANAHTLDSRAGCKQNLRECRDSEWQCRHQRKN
jgi:tetratricopeptide (TPR) repeat protein